MAASATASLPFQSSFVMRSAPLNGDHAVGAHPRATCAAGAFVHALDRRGMIALCVRLLAHHDDVPGADGQAKLAALAALFQKRNGSCQTDHLLNLNSIVVVPACFFFRQTLQIKTPRAFSCTAASQNTAPPATPTALQTVLQTRDISRECLLEPTILPAIPRRAIYHAW